MTDSSSNTRTLWRNAKLCTLAESSGWGIIDQGAIVTEGTQILWVGAEVDLPAALLQSAITQHDLDGRLLTPGLIDCHTHLVYGGNRASEFERRLQGATYEEIARSGGGIVSTVSATRSADDEALYKAAEQRALSFMAEGVTTLEVKSGYGLSLEHEARSLRTARLLAKRLPVTVQTTALCAHALPPEYAGQGDAYIDAASSWLRELKQEGLVDAVDAFCENIGFSPAQTERFFQAANALGLPVKLHAEQLSDQGGTQLAAKYGALSCDHLEYLSSEGIAAMAASGTVAVLLPGAYYFLRETKLPPVQALRDAKVSIAIASDHNPGTSPGLSLLLMLNMACTFFRLTPEEALRGVTVNAAKALGLEKTHGRLSAGMRADFAVWDIKHPNELSYWFGRNPCQQVIYGGAVREVRPFQPHN